MSGSLNEFEKFSAQRIQGEKLMLDLIIHGGTVITPSGVGQFDIGIQGEKIVLVAARDSILSLIHI